MKRKISIFFLMIVVAAFSMPIMSYAHSGRTDSKGGHYDWESGTYHYHHGYSAHQHYDIDGNGVLDCPYQYDFSKLPGYYRLINKAKDEGYEEGFADGEVRGKDIGYREAQSKLEEEYKSKLENEVTEAKSSAYLFSVIIGTPFVIFATSFFCQKSASKREKSFRDEISSLKQEVVKAKNYATVSGSYMNTDAVSEIPEGVILIPLVLPASGRTNEARPYGDYTIYTSPRGSKYHWRYGCGKATHPSHFYLKNSELEPCKNCVPANMYPGKLPDWYINVTRYKPPADEGTAKTDRAQKATKKSHVETASSVGPAPNSGIKEMSFNGNTLIVTFGNGKVFKYIDIPTVKGDALIKSSNPVQFFKHSIDGYYVYQLIKE